MAWYPEAAATPETEEPTSFIPPTMGNFIEPELKRFRESRALAKVTKEAGEFHAKMSKKYGVESEPGLAHARAARAYKESHQKLLEFFENGNELGELPPEVLIKTNSEAVKWHKQMAERHGVDSDEGHAHVAMMEHHMDVMNKAKQQKASIHGVSGRENPIAGVPEKKKQPSGDVRQNKPMMKLRGKNLANKEEAGVKGMKWGVRRPRGQMGPAAVRRLEKKLKQPETAQKDFGPEAQAQKSAMMKQYRKDLAKHQNILKQQRFGSESRAREHGGDGPLNRFLKGQARRQGTTPRVVKTSKYPAPRYDESHAEGEYEAPRYTKSHESKRFLEGKRKTATFSDGVPMKTGGQSAQKESPPLPPGFSRIGNVVFKEF